MACRRSARSLFFFARALLIFLSKAMRIPAQLALINKHGKTLEALPGRCAAHRTICSGHKMASLIATWTWADLSLLSRGS